MLRINIKNNLERTRPNACFLIAWQVWHICPLLLAPRVDGTFIPKEPETLLKEKKHMKIDIMTGGNADEGAFFVLRKLYLEANCYTLEQTGFIMHIVLLALDECILCIPNKTTS